MMSDRDKDGQLNGYLNFFLKKNIYFFLEDEFIIAMYLVDLVNSGQPIPASLPKSLTLKFFFLNKYKLIFF